MALNTIAQSSTVRQIGPSLSIVQLNAMAPARLTRPKLGRRPVTPQRSLGDTIEPSVSDPMPNGINPAAVAAHEPADEPLEPCSRFQGLRVLPPNQTSPIASSPKVVFATSTAPAASSFLITVASSSNTWLVYGAAPQVVG